MNATTTRNLNTSNVRKTTFSTIRVGQLFILAHNPGSWLMTDRMEGPDTICVDITSGRTALLSSHDTVLVQG